MLLRPYSSGSLHLRRAQLPFSLHAQHDHGLCRGGHAPQKLCSTTPICRVSGLLYYHPVMWKLAGHLGRPLNAAECPLCSAACLPTTCDIIICQHPFASHKRIRGASSTAVAQLEARSSTLWSGAPSCQSADPGSSLGQGLL